MWNFSSVNSVAMVYIVAKVAGEVVNVMPATDEPDEEMILAIALANKATHIEVHTPKTMPANYRRLVD